MNVTDISIMIPSYNTLNYLLMAYRSLRKYYPNNEIFIFDDGSTDGSWEWCVEQKMIDDNLRVWHNGSGKILGHTITYNMGAKACKGPLYTIFHSDMIAHRNYLENMLKHWKPKTVVCATRIEPDGIYPPGKEKILKPFGLEFHEFKEKEFADFCDREMAEQAGKTTRGIFAPWLISKDDYNESPMDEKNFAPWPEEDGDVFLRWHLAGYNLVQSRDSFVWHWISRGHRNWAQNGVGKDGPDFKFYQTRARRNYLRKWGRWMRFDEWHHPISQKVFDVAFVVSGLSSPEFLHHIEPWASRLYVDNAAIVEEYIAAEQPTTNVDLRSRIFTNMSDITGNVVLKFSEEDFRRDPNGCNNVLTNLNDILTGITDVGPYEYGPFKLNIMCIDDLASTLIKI